MKRTLILRYYAIIALTIYLFFLFYYYSLIGLFFPLWFSFASIILAIYSFLRSLFFHLDSALWLGMFLFLTAVINILHFLEPFTSTQLIALYFFAGAVSFAFVAIIYKNFTFLKISFVLSLEVILILLYSIYIFNLSIFILCNSAFIIILLISIVLHFKNMMSNSKTKK
ncbi:MAG: hypothetical protein PHR96_01095 [Clostridia bacterium]|nr:hypothetical protein [Clostridia bacterium]